METRVDIEAVYARYGPMVLRRCRRLLGDEASAVDAMQDTFVRLLARGAQLEDRGLSSYLYRAATHVCLDHLRRRRRRPETPEEELLLELASLDDPIERVAAVGLLARLFSSEPASTRTIAVLHLFDGLTLEETASEVGLSVSGVRKRLRKLSARARALTEGEPS